MKKLLLYINIKFLELSVSVLQKTFDFVGRKIGNNEAKFVLNKEIFERDFSHVYANTGCIIDSKSELSQFLIPLPFFVPFQNGWTITVEYKKSLISIIFRDYVRAVDIDPLGPVEKKDLNKIFIYRNHILSGIFFRMGRRARSRDRSNKFSYKSICQIK